MRWCNLHASRGGALSRHVRWARLHHVVPASPLALARQLVSASVELTCSAAHVSYLLTCSTVHVSYMLTCSAAHVSYLLTCTTVRQFFFFENYKSWWGGVLIQCGDRSLVIEIQNLKLPKSHHISWVSVGGMQWYACTRTCRKVYKNLGNPLLGWFLSRFYGLLKFGQGRWVGYKLMGWPLGVLHNLFRRNHP